MTSSTDTRSLISYAEQTSRVVLKLYRFTSPSNSSIYKHLNIPAAFIQALGLEDEVTAAIVATSDGRKGILLLKEKGQGTIGN